MGFTNKILFDWNICIWPFTTDTAGQWKNIDTKPLVSVIIQRCRKCFLFLEGCYRDNAILNLKYDDLFLLEKEILWRWKMQ